MAIYSSKSDTAYEQQRHSHPVDAVQLLQLRHKSRRWSQRMLQLSTLVGFLPVILAILYITLLATHLYSTEARFAIRGTDSSGAPAPSMGGIMSNGSGAGQVTGFVDGYAVRDFLQSRDAMRRLSKRMDFAAFVAKQVPDPLLRLSKTPTEDELFDAYSSLITVRYNMIEQIVVLDVEAYSPQDAVAIATNLLAITEEFADRMNQRARDDSFRVAEESVTTAEKRALSARTELAKWRSKNVNVDPTQDVTMLDAIIAQQEGQLTQAENDLSLIGKAGIARTPRRDTLEQQAQTLRGQIAKSRERLAGHNAQSPARISAYEELQGNLLFAENNLTSMRQTAEQTKLDVLRQQKFVVVIAEPTEDNEPSYPDPLIWLAGALATGMGLSFFGSVIIGLLRTRFMSRA